jgi:hypothetical protein
MPSHMVISVASPAPASRRLKASALRRLSGIVLVSGTVVAIVAAFGPIRTVRLGVAIAITTAVVACGFAWREFHAARHAHAHAMLAATREHGKALSEERTRNAAVVDALSQRICDAGKVIEMQRVRIAQQRRLISSLDGDRAYLKGEVEHRDKVISTLPETVREREAELIALREEPDAEVHHMPRRVLAQQEFMWDELHATDDVPAELVPTLVDFRVEMVLPNYEADRQPA